MFSLDNNVLTLFEFNEVKIKKNNKAAGPTGVVADMLKAAGDAGSIWATDMCNCSSRREDTTELVQELDDKCLQR